MISNRNIICMSSTEWGGDYIKATVELMKILSQNNRVLFVNSPVTIAEVVAHLRGKKQIDLKKVLGFSKRLQQISLPEGGEVHVLTPPVGLTINFLPAGTLYRVGLAFNAWQVRRSAKKALRQLNMNNSLLHMVAFNQGMGVANGKKYGESALIYHCYDDIRGVDPWARKHGVTLEEELMKKADGIIVTSKGLQKSKSTLNNRCFMVPNAANYNLFCQGFKLQKNEGQVIGYIGSIDDRIDYNIMEHLIGHMPQAKFVFVGRIVSRRGADILQKFPNVELVGAKVPAELPAYLKTFSAGIIPFVKNTLTNGIYPLKVNEYLAAGLPVISTDFGDMDEFASIACIIRDSNKHAFLECLLSEISEDNETKRLARQSVAKENTWTNRADLLGNAMLQIESNAKQKA